jgi:F-type H+-transporting ATPase subunit b
MRHITRLLLSAALGVAALVGLSTPAGAVGESIEGCTVEDVDGLIDERAEILDAVAAYREAKESGAITPGTPEYEDALHEVEAIVDSCIEAPNVLLPEINEVIWGAVGFLVVLFFMLKFGFPAAKKGMNDRTAKIQADLDAAEQAKADAEAVRSDYQSKVADAKAEAARIIEEARQSADQLRSDQQARLNEELAAARAQAQVDIDAAKGQAMSELRGEVATIAIGAAESVVGANLDRDAQTRLVEDYINRVQAAPSGNGQG